MSETVLVQHWAYHDGWTDVPTVVTRLANYTGPLREFDKDRVGWHCWAYPSNRQNFEDWMKQNMIKEYDCTFRFNSGDPMFTLTITDAEDAALFKLRWM